MSKIWLVWAEGGEYEDFSRDLRGIFATEDLANEHARRVVDLDNPDKVEVEVCEPLNKPLERGKMHNVSAGLNDDGSEWHHEWEWEPPESMIQAPGPKRGSFDVWIHEWPRLKSGIERDRKTGVPSWVFACGIDHSVVEERYAMLLAEARRELATLPGPSPMRL